MPEAGRLVSGFRIFKGTTYAQKKSVIEHLLLQGQKPSTLVISCADIRLSPAEIFATNPGELYVVNNVGGMVPKYDEKQGVHGIYSAIEYAVKYLEVQNVIVLGHLKCDAIKMMMSDDFSAGNKNLSHSMRTWLSVCSEARDAVKKHLGSKTAEEQQTACEHEAVVVSLRNLLTYPYVKERLTQKKIHVFGWLFNVEAGDITAFNPDTAYFNSII